LTLFVVSCCAFGGREHFQVALDKTHLLIDIAGREFGDFQSLCFGVFQQLSVISFDASDIASFWLSLLRFGINQTKVLHTSGLRSKLLE
jgi:hypothetical protein